MVKVNGAALQKELIKVSGSVLKCLHELSGTAALGGALGAQLTSSLEETTNALRGIPILEEGKYYKWMPSSYDKEEYAYLLYTGVYNGDEGYKAFFKLLAATKERINYEDLKDDIFVKLSNFRTSAYDVVEADLDPVKLMTFEKTGTLLEQMLKKGKKKDATV